MSTESLQLNLNHKPYFITIEGIEGVGKSTMCAYLSEKLTAYNINHILTREPGGTEVAEDIRQILLHKHQEPIASDTELLLMFASRAQHLASKIRPALKSKQWVVCDRFTDATFAYQGGGRRLDKAKIAILEELVQDDLRPDMTILLDLPAKMGLMRAQDRGEPDRIEQEQLSFFERVRQTYLERAQNEPERFYIIDTNKSIEKVYTEIDEILNQTITSMIEDELIL